MQSRCDKGCSRSRFSFPVRVAARILTLVVLPSLSLFWYDILVISYSSFLSIPNSFYKHLINKHEVHNHPPHRPGCRPCECPDNGVNNRHHTNYSVNLNYRRRGTGRDVPVRDHEVYRCLHPRRRGLHGEVHCCPQPRPSSRKRDKRLRRRLPQGQRHGRRQPRLPGVRRRVHREVLLHRHHGLPHRRHLTATHWDRNRGGGGYHDRRERGYCYFYQYQPGCRDDGRCWEWRKWHERECGADCDGEWGGEERDGDGGGGWVGWGGGWDGCAVRGMSVGS